MPTVKLQPAAVTSQPVIRAASDRSEEEREGVVHLIAHAGFEDGQHLRGQPSAECVRAERAEADAEKPGQSAQKEKGPIHFVDSNV